jgi:hypothetical protein
MHGEYSVSIITNRLFITNTLICEKVTNSSGCQVFRCVLKNAMVLDQASAAAPGL